MSYASASPVSSTSISISVGGLQYAANSYDGFLVYVYHNGNHIKTDGWTSSSSGTSTSHTVRNLEPDTTYYFDVYGLRNGEWYIGSPDATTYSDYTPPTPPEEDDDEPPEIWNVQAEPIRKSNGTYNIKVTWSAYDNEGIVEHWAYRSRPNYANYESIGYSLSGSARSYTFTSDANGNPFKAGNRYHFMIRAVDAAGNISPQIDGKVYIDIKEDRPENWSWSYNIYSGGSVYRTTVSGNKVIVYIMPASEWNRFTSRINEFRKYKGLYEWNFTTVSSEDNFTASRVNEAVNAINNIGFSISKMSYRGLVPARVFNEMRDCLNSIK